jgi:di/tricarboxylate transporter
MDLRRHRGIHALSGYILVLTAFITPFTSGVAVAAAMLRLLEKVSMKVLSFEEYGRAITEQGKR